MFASSHTRRRRRSLVQGFTLIEVLVALAIMSLMAVLTWRGIDGITRAQQATQRYTDDVLALQAGLGQWQADLNAMMVWQDASIATTTTGTPATTKSTPNRSLFWDGNTLRITRLAADDPASGLRVVAWTRRAGNGQWLRWQSAPVLSQQAWRTAWEAAARWGATASLQRASSEGAQETVIANTVDWQLHYFRKNAWTNPLSSASEGEDLIATVPDGLRLMITLAPGQALSGPLQVDWIRPTFGGDS